MFYTFPWCFHGPRPAPPIDEPPLLYDCETCLGTNEEALKVLSFLRITWDMFPSWWKTCLFIDCRQNPWSQSNRRAAREIMLCTESGFTNFIYIKKCNQKIATTAFVIICKQTPLVPFAKMWHWCSSLENINATGSRIYLHHVKIVQGLHELAVRWRTDTVAGFLWRWVVLLKILESWMFDERSVGLIRELLRLLLPSPTGWRSSSLFRLTSPTGTVKSFILLPSQLFSGKESKSSD